MQEFAFKPAVLGAEQVWAIKDGRDAADAMHARMKAAAKFDKQAAE